MFVKWRLLDESASSISKVGVKFSDLIAPFLESSTQTVLLWKMSWDWQHKEKSNNSFSRPIFVFYIGFVQVLGFCLSVPVCIPNALKKCSPIPHSLLVGKLQQSSLALARIPLWDWCLVPDTWWADILLWMDKCSKPRCQYLLYFGNSPIH